MRNWLLPLVGKLRPQKGWTSLVLMFSLQLALVGSLRQTDWVNFRSSHLPLEVAPVVGLLWLWVFLRLGMGREGLKGSVRNLLALVGAIFLVAALWLQQMTNIAGRWILWRPTEFESLKQLARELWKYMALEGAMSMNSFSTRLSFWLEGVRGSGAQQDDLILIGIGSLFLVLLALQSTWMFLQGRSVLICMLPSLAVLTYILYFSRGSRLHLLGYLALLLALFAWSQQLNLVENWQRRNIDYPDGIAFDRAVGLVSALLVMGLTAGIVPSIDVARITDWVQDSFRPMDEATGDFGERMFPDLQSQVGGQNRGSAGGLPNSFLLGDSPDLSTRVVMRVTASYPFAEEQGFYMRGTIYESYNGRGWSNTSSAFGESLAANTSLDLPIYPYRREIWQAVELEGAVPIAHAIAEPIKFSVKVRPETNRWGLPLYYRNLERDSYSVLSAMPILSEAILREVPWEAYEAIPSENLETYLALPETVTVRTLSLAEELGRNIETPYDLGLAVETFLRNYPYDLQVTLPGAGVQDVADYFLFELERGFCDYYTTAFVVLMRANNLPVRFAVGYAPGYYTQYTEEWVITDAQAHSWPEVWFPGLGWVPFEPTAGRPSLDRSYLPTTLGTEGVIFGTEGDPLLSGLPNTSDFPWRATLVWSFLLLAIAVLVFFRQWRSSSRDPWVSLLVWGRRLGRAKWEWETENEYAASFSSFLRDKDKVEEDDARAMGRQIVLIKDAAVRSRYGPKTPASETSMLAEEHWQHLQSRLRRIYLLRH